jgi:hypothetical protein
MMARRNRPEDASPGEHAREIELMPTSDGSVYGFKYVNGHRVSLCGIHGRATDKELRNLTISEAAVSSLWAALPLKER